MCWALSSCGRVTRLKIDIHERMRNISAHSHLVLWIVNQNFLLSRKRSICSEGGHYVKVGEVGTFLEMGHIYGHLLKQVET